MEITEKLNIFYESAIDVANKQSSDTMREFSKSMEKLRDEYKKSKKDEMESRYHIELGKLKRDMNCQVSDAIMEQKRQLNLRQQEKKQALFQVVEAKLKDYQKTDSYQEYLISKIRMAKEFARQEEIVIYLNPSDAGRQEYLEEKTGCHLTISESDFGGGIRAVIRSKNVLIDESFGSKLNQERDGYTF